MNHLATAILKKLSKLYLYQNSLKICFLALSKPKFSVHFRRFDLLCPSVIEFFSQYHSAFKTKFKDQAFKCLSYLFLLYLSSCSPSTQEEFYIEGQSSCQKLVSILEEVNSKEELLKKKNALKKEFCELAGIIIQAKKFQERQKNTSSFANLENQENISSRRLKQELQRIYLLDQGRDIIEMCQKEALDKLDRFEKTKK